MTLDPNQTKPSLSPDAYRDALRHFAAGVTLVTTRTPEITHGLTVSAFASVSPEPPLIAVIIDQRHQMYPLLERPDACFAVNVLGADQEALSNRFAFVKEEDRFAEGRWGEAATGSPILEDALVWLDCRVYARYPAGTHTIYIGEVVASQVPRPDESPLVYWNRDYRRFSDGSSSAPEE